MCEISLKPCKTRIFQQIFVFLLRLERRLHIAHNMQQPPPTYTTPLPDLQQLKIDVDFPICTGLGDHVALASADDAIQQQLLQQSVQTQPTYVTPTLERTQAPEFGAFTSATIAYDSSYSHIPPQVGSWGELQAATMEFTFS